MTSWPRLPCQRWKRRPHRRMGQASGRSAVPTASLHLPPPQLNRSLAAFAVFILVHDDRADVAPIIDLVFAVLGDLKDANDLNRGRGGIAPHEQLDLHRSQPFILAKRA